MAVRCVAALASLTFEEHLPLLDARQSVTRLILGDQAPGAESSTAEPASGPIRVDIEEERTRVVVHAHGWSVSRELADSLVEFVEALTAQYLRVQGAFDGLPLRSAALNSAWVDPVDTDWGTLVDQFRQAFMTDYGLAREANDLGQGFDFTGDGFLGSAHIGPMQRDQLIQDYFSFGDDDAVPDQFSFADIRYEITADDSSRLEDPREFFLQGILYGERLAEAFAVQFRKAE